jgi:serine/threonine-protein kinase
MSPEQVFGERDLDQRSDVWALGVILYECLSGIVPTRAPNVGQVFKLIVAGGIKPLETVLPEAPADIVALVHRMLARRRDQRPFDLNEIAEVLGRYTGVKVPPFGAPQIPGVQAPPGDAPGEPLPNADETIKRLGTAGADTGEEAAPLRSRMSRLTTIGLGVLVVSVLLGESFLLWRGRAHVPAHESVQRVAPPADAGTTTAPRATASPVAAPP